MKSLTKPSDLDKVQVNNFNLNEEIPQEMNDKKSNNSEDFNY